MSNAEKSTIDQHELLQHVALLRDRLASTPAQPPWKQLWKVLNVFEVVAKSQEQIVKDAEQLITQLQELEEEQQVEFDANTKEHLAQIVEGRDEERERYFALALFWRRHAIWHHLHVNPSDVEGALQLVSRYLIASPKQVQVSQTCYPSQNGAAGTTTLVEVADLCRDRLRRIDRWLKEHPEAAAKLNDKKGKGKHKEVDKERTDNEIRHLLVCLREIEPPARLHELLTATEDWLNAYESRLVYLGKLKQECHGIMEAIEGEAANAAKARMSEADGAGHEQDEDDAKAAEAAIFRSSRSVSIPIQQRSADSKQIEPPDPGEMTTDLNLPKRLASAVIRGPASEPKDHPPNHSRIAGGQSNADIPNLPWHSTEGAITMAAESTGRQPAPAIQPPTDHEKIAREERAIRTARRRTMDRGTSPIPELVLAGEASDIAAVATEKALQAAQHASDINSQSQSTGTDSQNTVQSNISSNLQDHTPPSPTSLPNISPSPPPPPGQSRPQPHDIPSSRATTPPSVIRAAPNSKCLAHVRSSHATDDLSAQLNRVEEQHQPFLSLGVRSSPTLVSSDPQLTRLPAPAQTRAALHSSTSSRPETVPQAATPRSRKEPEIEVVVPVPVPSPVKRLVEAAALEAENKRKLASLTEEPSYNRLFEGLQMIVVPEATKKRKQSPSKAASMVRSEHAHGIPDSSARQRSPKRSEGTRRASLAVSTFSDIDGSYSSQGARHRAETEEIVGWLSQEEGQ